ncbi:MAG: hypothetical protein DRJ47_06110 [Thermoprotei archaeon]|nr:MAG: hypothetical protein DRJ47_06110 [Thermoprotei archaeon]
MRTIFYLTKFQYADIKDALDDICDKDDTFRYDIKHMGSKVKLIVYSETEKQAYARGFWIRDKLGIDVGFAVRR